MLHMGCIKKAEPQAINSISQVPPAKGKTKPLACERHGIIEAYVKRIISIIFRKAYDLILGFNIQNFYFNRHEFIKKKIVAFYYCCIT